MGDVEVAARAEAPAAAVSRLEARHLKKSYGGRQVVQDVSLAVDKGEVVGLLGPNGAGKTTSFYMIVGLVRADAGEISIDGRPVEHMPIHRRSRLGLSYLPQEASIFRKLNVEDNVRAVKAVAPHVSMMPTNSGWFLAQAAIGSDGILSGLGSLTPNFLCDMWEATQAENLRAMRAAVAPTFP